MMQRTPPPALTSTILSLCVATSFLYGQQARRDGKEITGALNEIYKPGQELIVFLNVSPTAGGFTVAYGKKGEPRPDVDSTLTETVGDVDVSLAALKDILPACES
jgi:hypothetical protein